MILPPARRKPSGCRRRGPWTSVVPDKKTDRCLVNIYSWTLPLTIYDFDAQKDTFAKSIFNTDVSYPGFENLVSEEVEAPGHDGVMIPLSIIYKKGIPLDGSNCCILRGYGAYGFSAIPSFSIFNSLANRGVVLAFAHVRGGSEKGEAWYKAGFKTTKPNTWKDFISCAEYLVAKGYTSPSKLAGTGTSAGGILISRAITDRPDLFGGGAVQCRVRERDADGVHAQRPGQHAGIRHGEGPRRVPGVIRDGRRPARPSRA